jgi:uncharacterized protein
MESDSALHVLPNQEGADLFNMIKKSFITAFIIAYGGGLFFSLISVPIPWLLGPMAAILIASRFKKVKLSWPPFLRDAALVIVGYSIGLSFTREAILNIFQNLPMMLILTVLLISFSALIAYIVSRISGVDYPTVLTGSIPGGLSQMILFAEETKSIDITTVTFMQVSRLLMIVFFVPFIIFGPVLNIEHTEIRPLPEMTANFSLSAALLFALAAIFSAFLGRRFRFPTPFLLGPIIGTAVLVNIGVSGPVLPPVMLDISQFMIGGYIGLLLKPEKLKRKTTTITLALMSGVLLVFASFLVSINIKDVLSLTIVTSFLSLAPGGMDQMGIIAHEVNADLSMVIGFQLFRLFFIYFAIPPILRWYFLNGIGQKKESL